MFISIYIITLERPLLKKISNIILNSLFKVYYSRLLTLICSFIFKKYTVKEKKSYVILLPIHSLKERSMSLESLEI